jgi:exonuclease I
MPKRPTSELLARADAISAEVKAEIAMAKDLRKQSARLMDQLHEGMRDLHAIEEKSHAVLTISQKRLAR